MSKQILQADVEETRGLAQLPYFLGWRPSLWGPPVRSLIGDPTRFRNKKVLELGSRTGRMASLFGLLGADVLGVDLPNVPLTAAREEAARWGVADRVRFDNYDGDPRHLPDGDFDFVFTKSVLVMIPNLEPFLAGLATKLKPDGEILAAENASWPILNFLRRHVIHRGKEFPNRFHGVDTAFLAMIRRQFELISHRQYYCLVSAIRARRR